jgi:hypothetical protein
MPYKGVFYLVEIDLKLHFFDQSKMYLCLNIEVCFLKDTLQQCKTIENRFGCSEKHKHTE